jgi:hypothetical protein
MSELLPITDSLCRCNREIFSASLNHRQSSSVEPQDHQESRTAIRRERLTSQVSGFSLLVFDGATDDD